VHDGELVHGEGVLRRRAGGERHDGAGGEEDQRAGAPPSGNPESQAATLRASTGAGSGDPMELSGSLRASPDLEIDVTGLTLEGG